MLFDRSTSSPDLQSERQTVSAVPPRRSTSAYSLVDRTATALPQYPPASAAPTRHANEPSAPIVPSSLRHELPTSPRVPSQTVKPAVVKTWRKLAEQVKKVFGRRKKSKDKEPVEGLKIGSPTDFQHVQTWNDDRPLRIADGTFNPKPTTPGGDSGPPRRVRFADENQHVRVSRQYTSEAGPSRGPSRREALTAHPLGTLHEECLLTNKDDDDDKFHNGKQYDSSGYDADSDSSSESESSESEESRWQQYLALRKKEARVKDAGTQSEDFGAQSEHFGAQPEHYLYYQMRR